MLLIQWLFIRVCVAADKDRNIVGCYVIGFIIPLTGWWGKYWWVLPVGSYSRKLKKHFNRQQKPRP